MRRRAVQSTAWALGIPVSLQVLKLQIGSPSLSIEVVRVSRQRDGRGRRGWWYGIDAGVV